MSGQCMEFPKNIHEFIEDYSFFDKDKVYTNGSQLISTFRVMQMLAHYAPGILSDEKYINYTAGTLKKVQDDHVLYKREWLKKHWDMEEALIFGLECPNVPAIDNILDDIVNDVDHLKKVASDHVYVAINDVFDVIDKHRGAKSDERDI